MPLAISTLADRQSASGCLILLLENLLSALSSISYMPRGIKVDIKRTAAFRHLQRMDSAFRLWRVAHRSFKFEPALRSELFSADQMEQYGPQLASLHKINPKPIADSLLARLAENKAHLASSYERLTSATLSDRQITPAGEWLLDNFYLIEEQIRTAQKHLPKGYSRELPQLLNGPSVGKPRVYDIALEIISHGDGRVDSEGLERFVVAYQAVTPLTLGELWAIPIMLRLALIENLRRVASRVMSSWTDRHLADDWADRMIEMVEQDPKSVLLTVSEMVHSQPPISSSFVAELARRLQGQNASLILPLNWIEQLLSESELSIERLVRLDAQQQAADQVSISNSINSLRLLSATDWRDFVEHMSQVEQLLREDPAGIYSQMDFATRDRYRHVIERLARYSPHTEREVTRMALALTQASRLPNSPENRQGHVGFYLVDKGLPELERSLSLRRPLAEQWQRLLRCAPLPLYLGMILGLTLLLAWPFLAMARHSGWLGPLLMVLLAVPAVLMTSRLAVEWVNWLITLTLSPRLLPRMDYSHGIPAEACTLVIVPTLIGSAQDIEELVEGLEVRFLANRDAHVHFALLTDFMDAATEVLAQDAPLLALAQQRIEALNLKYPCPPTDRFFLFHRARVWNPSEQVWMSYERKRGKISELNALLRGKGQERFARIVGKLALLPPVQYVITLDTDTQLPRNVARQLVGAMAHPLNRAVYDPQRRRITAGYAILQPRIGISLPSAARSLYARLFGSEAGIDPYTRAVSDVYQDLFQQGSFIGKGIYAVDAFEQALEGRLPDNRILSHDLIEGCYARSGLLTDVQLYEAFPSCYSADVKRRHRWIRGDWQLLPWLLFKTPKAEGGFEPNTLCILSRWKILDNLRRSLESSAFLLMLVAGWLFVPQPLLWTLAILSLLLISPCMALLIDACHKPDEVSLRPHLKASVHTAGPAFAQALLTLIWLPYTALYSLDAIYRTLWRLSISKRYLLQWRPSQEVERSTKRDLPSFQRLMWSAPLLSGLTLGVLILVRPEALQGNGLLLLLWAISPILTWWLSKPFQRKAFHPDVSQERFLQLLARRTWAFFDQYVGPMDNWLPPDNIQEQPKALIAHRTSPTNIGMALLANLAAYDFGYLSAKRLLERTELSLTSMAKLERYRQHFYNWYDTLSLKPLPPCYVSTVDSGNLAGLLLTLRPGLRALADDPVFDPRLLKGLQDTFEVLCEAFHASDTDLYSLRPFQARLSLALEHPPQSLAEAADCLEELLQSACSLLENSGLPSESDAAFWQQALIAHCQDAYAQLSGLRLAPPPDTQTFNPSWRQLAALEPSLWPDEASQTLARAARLYAETLLDKANLLADWTGSLAEMDFSLLYDSQRDLFSIGYAVEEQRLDAGYYDLLASEVRLTHFVAIAQGQIPQEGWFSLGRLLTTQGGVPVLLSWSGSMFEYLMPLLVMPNYQGSLLDQTCQAAVARHIEQGRQLGLPWGVSESGYNTLDIHFNYQYHAFGVPGLGLKRGLGEDRVIAPYASVLALMVAPEAACLNLQRLAAQGLAGRYGLYEAVDFTPSRVPRGQSCAIVRSFMAHHQGMSLLALLSVLKERPMQRRFVSDPQCQASLLLLQERIPKTAEEYLHTSGPAERDISTPAAEIKLRVFSNPAHKQPAVQLLSNGHYHVMVSAVGSGYSRCGDMALTRWQADSTCDNGGMFCYLRDVDSGAFWSSSHQPTLKRPEHYEAIFSDARAEFRVRERDFDTHTEIVVSPEDDIELRRLHITNRAPICRSIELTSYAEVVLAPAISDALHPAFSKLFVQTELLTPLQAILCTRRPRSRQEAEPWMCHALAAHGAHVESISYETDRARFIGRGRSLIHPVALCDSAENDGQLSNTAGSVLDPIVAIRCRISLEPGQTATIDLITGSAGNRAACVQLIDKYRDRHLADRVFDLAWTHSQVLLRQLNISLSDAKFYEQMAASVLYNNPLFRAEASLLSSNHRNQSGLWGQAISGDLPIVLLQIADPDNIELVRQLVQAHAYWRQKGLAVDLVIWNEDRAGYRQHLQELIIGLITSSEAHLLDRPGGIFVRPAQQLSSEDRILMQSVARLILSDSQGTLAEQLQRRRVQTSLPQFDPRQLRDSNDLPVAPSVTAESAALLLHNNYGGFSADGREYVIHLAPGMATPAPWVNVLANPYFGSVISESGSAYTWYENAHEFRLSPWLNDPVTDASGEALYLRDEDSGRYWSPTPLPRRGTGAYLTRHGFGYSCFEHTEDGIQTELWVYVALDAPLKYWWLKVRNLSNRPRQLSSTGYVEWVLGDLREKSAMHINLERDPSSGALLARNAYSIAFSEWVGFFAVDAPTSSFTGDRSEFLGRNGHLQAPAAMVQNRLSGRLGAGLDPCSALRSSFRLEAGASRDIVFCLGAEQSTQAASDLIKRACSLPAATEALERVRAHWQAVLGQIQVQTPDPALNVLVNGWLIYQVIACRFWARSGYYQSGGAFGFRDQLQDSMAMLHAAPAEARQHLLLCASHQFVEGDVQHWWHPPQDRGVRTGCSDDYLWLVAATSRYVTLTGDYAILDEQLGYLEGRALHVGEESYYDQPKHAPIRESLYQHCQRALKHAQPRGPHGLPLMGCGDWNDGMNLVGEHGVGESIWLGFFLYRVLLDFSAVARQCGDEAFAGQCESQAQLLQTHLEQDGWDGAWYRRAYFDDGTPLGSASNAECQIDAIAQSWSVLSGAAPEGRQHQAMASLQQRLVRPELSLIQLLDPPFDQSAVDPGYIKGYVPGVRENGGQYTHAAVWACMAFARLGDGEQAWKLLNMINPVNHAKDASSVERYKVEPYVVAADLYSCSAHAGRGGWSWYTGAAGWMYRLIVESLLGVRREGAWLHLQPLLPADWPEVKLCYEVGASRYHVLIKQRLGAAYQAPQLSLDGQLQEALAIPLVDDGQVHQAIYQFSAPSVQASD